MTVKNKLLLCAVLVALVQSLVFVLVFDINGKTKQLTDMLLWSNKLQLDLERSFSNERNFLISENFHDGESAIELTEQLSSMLDELIVSQTDSKTLSYLNQLRQHLLAYGTGVKQAIDIYKSGSQANKTQHKQSLLQLEYQLQLSVGNWVEYLNEKSERLQHASQQYQQQIILVLITTIVLVSGFNFFISHAIVRSIARLAKTVHQAQVNNDLSVRASTSEDEIGQIGADVNVLLQHIQQVFAEVKAMVGSLWSEMDLLNAHTGSTQSGMSRQRQELTQASAAATQMKQSITQVVSHTELAAKSAEHTSESALAGRKQVDKTILEINQLVDNLDSSSGNIKLLEQESGQVSQVLEVISSIAEQTNLLALNAAIEAARAGEQGRGFAVVADEVRELAMRTKESTSQITHIIEELQHNISVIVGQIGQCREQGKVSAKSASVAGAQLQQITEDIDQVSTMNQQIAAAVSQQNQASYAMNQTIEVVEDIAQRSSDHAKESRELCQLVYQQATHLNELMEQFKR